MAFVFNKSTPANGAEAMYNLKACLVAAGWVVRASGDGLSAYSSTTDVITQPSSGANGMNNSQAWFRIADPANVREFLLRRGSSGDQYWSFYFSRTSKFTTGGSAAVRATAADEVNQFGVNTTGSVFFTILGGLYRWKVGADNAAPYGFWSASVLNGGGLPQACFVYEHFTAAEPTDAHPLMTMLATTQAAGQVFGNVHMVALSVADRTVMYSWYPSTGASGGWYVRAMTYGYNTSGIPGGFPNNLISLKDEVLPIPYGIINGGTIPAYKGVGYIMKWNGTARQTGDTMSISGSRDRIVMADVNLPWDGTIPQL